VVVHEVDSYFLASPCFGFAFVSQIVLPLSDSLLGKVR
jgi:hypothetical protein